jgi:hypothetical protein
MLPNIFNSRLINYKTLRVLLDSLLVRAILGSSILLKIKNDFLNSAKDGESDMQGLHEPRDRYVGGAKTHSPV